MSDNDKIFAALLDIKSDMGATKGHVETIRKSIPDLYRKTTAIQTQVDATRIEVELQGKRVGLLETKIGKATVIALVLLGSGLGGKELCVMLMKALGGGQ